MKTDRWEADLVALGSALNLLLGLAVRIDRSRVYQRRALATCLCWLAATAGCVPNEPLDPASTGQAIIGGQLESGYPEVGLLSFEVAGKRLPYADEPPPAPGTAMICTGTLIGPRQVLTAAHCVDDLKRGWLELDQGPSPGIPFYAPVIHPSYAGFMGLKGDIAIVFVPEPIEGVSFPQLADQPPQAGEPVTMVGCGKTTLEQASDTLKRSATNSVEAVQPYTLSAAGHRWGDGIFLPGDSGGPTYVTRGGQQQLAGVHSLYKKDLTTLWIFDTSGAWDTRVDVYTDWISQVAWNPPPPPLPLLRLHTPLHTQMPASFDLQLSATSRVPMKEISIAIDGGAPQSSSGGAVRQRIGPLTVGSHVVAVSARDQDGFVARQQWRFVVSGAGAGPPMAYGNPAPLASTPAPTPIADPRGSAACPDPAAPTCGLPPWEASTDEGGCAVRRSGDGAQGRETRVPPLALPGLGALLLALRRTRRRTGRER